MWCQAVLCRWVYDDVPFCADIVFRRRVYEDVAFLLWKLCPLSVMVDAPASVHRARRSAPTDAFYFLLFIGVAVLVQFC